MLKMPWELRYSGENGEEIYPPEEGIATYFSILVCGQRSLVGYSQWGAKSQTGMK